MAPIARQLFCDNDSFLLRVDPAEAGRVIQQLSNLSYQDNSDSRLAARTLPDGKTFVQISAPDSGGIQGLLSEFALLEHPNKASTALYYETLVTVSFDTKSRASVVIYADFLMSSPVYSILRSSLAEYWDETDPDLLVFRTAERRVVDVISDLGFRRLNADTEASWCGAPPLTPTEWSWHEL